MSPASISRARPPEPSKARPDAETIRVDVRARAQQGDNTRLFGREEMVSQQFGLLEAALVGLGDVLGVGERRPQHSHAATTTGSFYSAVDQIFPGSHLFPGRL